MPGRASADSTLCGTGLAYLVAVNVGQMDTCPSILLQLFSRPSYHTLQIIAETKRKTVIFEYR
jgi:hypothetical protein